MAEAEYIESYRPKASLNWALMGGGFLAVLVILVAVYGPSFAPRDPLENSFIGQVGTRFIRPPYPPGAVEGYPLGSDENGRDVLSRLLWAVQPTMTMVLVVAALRLSIGLLIGLIAGWSSGRVGRVLDGLISGALSIPVLLVALCIAAAMAHRWGVWAFILGLSLTGWAETARLTHDQARLIRSQPYIEAAGAMGASSGQLIYSHVIPQVLPLIWIQLAFEISATLVAVAAMGFLGYFVNAVWIPGDGDFVGIRASGAPELGQMLGVAIRNQPWTAVVAGSCVFVIVLAFNLLGEGLRNALGERKKITNSVANRAGSWVEERVFLALAEWRRLATAVSAFAVLFLAVLGGGWLLWQAQNSVLGETQIQIPGGHLWASQLRDAQGTLWTDLPGPSQPDIAWQTSFESGFTAGPVIDSSGNLYLTTAGNQLVSYNNQGELRWRFDLPISPVGYPAVAADGSIIVVGENGDVFACSPTGQLIWRYTSDPPDTVISGPVIGPGGLIYYAMRNFLVALNYQGQRSWQIRLPTYSYSFPLPRLTADGKHLFFEDFVIDAQSGVTEFRESPEPMDRYMVGADGNSYFRSAESVVRWQVTETGAVLIPSARLDPNAIAAGYRFPFNAGVSPAGDIWLLYSGAFEYDRLIWTDPKGNSPQVINFPYQNGRLIGFDSQANAYICGHPPAKPYECRAVQLNTGSLLWKVELDLDTRDGLVGGALIGGRMYLVAASGRLIAFGQ